MRDTCLSYIRGKLHRKICVLRISTPVGFIDKKNQLELQVVAFYE